MSPPCRYAALRYDDAAGGNLINTGPSYTTPILSNTTTYYVENDAGGSSQYIGEVNSSFGSGGYFTSSTYHYLIFTSINGFKLVSVWVNANTAGNRTIELRSSAGTVLQSAIVNIPAGQSRITLNFNVPAGTDLQLGTAGPNDLYRNSAGATYPYSLAGIVSITGNSAGDLGYYYYFYDWEVKQSCTSSLIPVTATINPVLPAPEITQSGDTLYSNAPYGNQWYSSGSGIIPGANGTYFTPLQYGSYYVIVNDGNFCSPDTSNIITVNLIGISENSSSTFRIFPNPNNGIFTVDIGNYNTKNAVIEIYDLVGKLIFRELPNDRSVKINAMNFDNGIYFMKISSGMNTSTQKIIVSRIN